jgi:hypothetical protein
MILYLILVLAIAAIFYLAVPGTGAFLVRGEWRRFRRTIGEISRYPMASMRTMVRGKNAFIGYFRFFGTLEAIQGDDRIWIADGHGSVAVDLKRLNVYMLPASSPKGAREEAELAAVPWNRIFSLSEGTTVLVGGALFAEEGRGVFRPQGKRKPLVVIYDCKRENIVPQAVRSGRQRNEFWNLFTIPSTVTGSFLLFLIAYFLLGAVDQRIPALISLAVCLAPIAPFLPPAFPLYFLFRFFWKKARLLRAERDLVMLPMRYFPPMGIRGSAGENPRQLRATLLPDLEPYIMLRGSECPGDPPYITASGEKILVPAETRRLELSHGAGGESFVFGAYDEIDGVIRLRKPNDPMAELVLVPGNPEQIARKCNDAARLYEIVSAIFIGVSIAINVTAILFLLSYIVG